MNESRPLVPRNSKLLEIPQYSLQSLIQAIDDGCYLVADEIVCNYLRNFTKEKIVKCCLNFETEFTEPSGYIDLYDASWYYVGKTDNEKRKKGTCIQIYDNTYIKDENNEIRTFPLKCFVYVYGEEQRMKKVYIEESGLPIYYEILEQLKQIEYKINSIRICEDAFNEECKVTADKICTFFKPENVQKLRKLGFPSQYGLVLVGKPGCGKSVFVNHLYNKLKLSGFIDQMVKYTPAEVMNNAQQGYDIEDAGVLVFDDVDSILKEKCAEDRNDVVLSWFLTQTDVTMSVNVNRLLILVANSLDFVEPAIIRPGRFDSIIRFSSPTLEQIIKMIMFVTKNDPTITSEIITESAQIVQDAVDYENDGKKSADQISFANIALSARMYYTGMADSWIEAFTKSCTRDFSDKIIVSSSKKKCAGFNTESSSDKLGIKSDVEKIMHQILNKGGQVAPVIK